MIPCSRGSNVILVFVGFLRLFAAMLCLVASAVVIREMTHVPISSPKESTFLRMVFFLTGISLFAGLHCLLKGKALTEHTASNPFTPLALLVLSRLVSAELFLLALGWAYAYAFQSVFYRKRSGGLSKTALAWGMMILVSSCLTSSILCGQILPSDGIPAHELRWLSDLDKFHQSR